MFKVRDLDTMTRVYVLHRDKEQCFSCGGMRTEHRHLFIYQLSKSLPTTEECNLVTACENCHDKVLRYCAKMIHVAAYREKRGRHG